VKYISLNDLTKELSLEKKLSSAQILEILKEKNYYNYSNVEEFLSIQNNQTSVFNSWIEQHQPLKDLLTTGKTQELFSDKHHWSKHALYESFKSYLSPFFLDLLTRKSESEISTEWAKIFSFFQLIEDENRFFIEQSFYQNIKNKIELEISKCNTQLSENEFHQSLLFILSDDCISIHNSLSRASHSLKIDFSEKILQLFYHEKCSAKLANWMIIQLAKMELNEEQLNSLSSIKKKIKSGEIQFQQVTRKNKVSRARQISLSLIILSVFGLLIFYFNQQYTYVPPNFKEQSSLSEFSVKERKEIDSLLKSMNSNNLDSSGQYISGGTSITMRVPIINLYVEKIYQELELDLTNHFSGVYNANNSISKENLKTEKILETKNLNELKSKNEIEFKNDSEYLLLFLVWDETKNGSVYSGLLPKKSVLKLNGSKDMKMLILPGIDYEKIQANELKNFKILKNHFCSIDFNYEYALQKILTIGMTSSKNSRVLIEGIQGDVLSVTDADGILIE
jgi:hypothetical protein